MFERLGLFAQRVTGHPASFAVALGVVLAWAITGPLFGYSDTWQLVINTGTTIATFLLGFLVQGALNRQAERDRGLLEEIKRLVEREQKEIEDIEEVLGGE